MPHVVLWGDSIFDNAAHVGNGLSVIEKLRRHLAPDWQATLLAIDGDVTEEVHAQTRKLPPGASHLIVSCGGNDALGQLGLLQEPTAPIIAALNRLAGVLDAFILDYRAMLDHVKTLNRNVAVCTIYDSIPQFDRGMLKGLALFNDVILREAIRAGVPVFASVAISMIKLKFGMTLDPESLIQTQRRTLASTLNIRMWQFGCCE